MELLAHDHGDEQAANMLCVHPSTLNKALAKRQLRRSTIICIRSRLEAFFDLAPALKGSDP